MQNRIGPNKAGPWGILQTLADGIKLFFKEDLVPTRAIASSSSSRHISRSYPRFGVGVIRSAATSAVARPARLSGANVTRFQLADPAIGALPLALSAIGVYGIMLAAGQVAAKSTASIPAASAP